MVVEKLSTLPIFIRFEDVVFRLFIWHNTPDDLRICYSINDVHPNSKHFELYEKTDSWFNPFLSNWPNDLKSFLYLEEGIETDQEFCDAIDECREWLVKNGLIE